MDKVFYYRMPKTMRSLWLNKGAYQWRLHYWAFRQFRPTIRLYVGNIGMHGNLAPNEMTQQSDLIISVGMRFSDRVTGDVKATLHMRK